MDIQKIKVIIVDDHAILRSGIKQILLASGDIDVVGEAENVAQAIKCVREVAADVMLLDISLPDKTGIEALKLIKRENAALNILMLSMYMEEQYAVRSIRSGASGYLCKHTASEELLTAIHTLAKGKKYITPNVAEILAEQVGNDYAVALHETLSDREFQVMRMIASGQSVSEIADKLALSVKTVSMYRTRLLEKMHLKHNADITHYAIKNQLV
ncbi:MULTISPECIES: response regulator transcription factor [unclassified Methylophilus]|uniref:Response regulator n=1 Tax=Methylophilus glucosoxydans TaxID=752553 RepID=A0ABW3GI06_9PROT|nr:MULTISPECIES: response regulator transcription factor [unclassified Methylophilus]MDF0376975.1 response regulator [Methylophilus sp. YYY-1]MDT7850038.1 response regulator transcription factor [Methylophilus sp. VKM B-3414]BEV08250.1 response regulator transcription factor [Methylophilus sp. DW102]